MKGIYVLELNNGCYYVGKSIDIEKRINSHKQNKGAVYVKKCRGVKGILQPIIERTDDLNEWELKETLVRMYIHGINNVRGFCYSQYKIYDKRLVYKIKSRIKKVIEPSILEKYDYYNGLITINKNILISSILQILIFEYFNLV